MVYAARASAEVRSLDDFFDAERLRAGFSVLFEDDALYAVFKPSGLAVHQGWVREPLVLVDLVRERTGEQTVYPIHRLDRGTSGVVLFARSPEVARTLQGALSDEAHKTYVALVRGVTREEQGFIDHPVRRDEEGEERAEAQTRWRRLAQAPTTPRHTSLLEVQPLTGRLHQIRRHLKHISHPIIGDANYGKGPINREMRATYGLARLALHARSIALPHPLTGEPLHIHAPLPDDLAGPLRAMGYTLE